MRRLIAIPLVVGFLGLPLLSVEAQQASDFAEYLRKSDLPELYYTELRSACLENCDLGACRQLVTYLNDLDRTEDALELAESIECEPERMNLDARFIKAQALYQAGRCDQAIAILDGLIEELPPKDIMIESVFMKAQCQVRAGDFDGARLNLKSIEPHMPKAARPLFLIYLASAEENLGNVSEAEKLYREAMEGQQAQATLGLLRCALKTGGLDEFTRLYGDIPDGSRELLRAVACEHAPGLDIAFPETWRMLMRPVLADTGFTASTCPEVKTSIVRMAEQGEDVHLYCDALLSRTAAPGAGRELRYARALSLADSTGSCDTLLVLARQAQTAAFRARCIGASMAIALRKDRLGLVTEIIPRLGGLVEGLRPEERLELARMFLQAGQGPRAEANLEVLLEDLESDYDHSAVMEVAAMLERAGGSDLAVSLYRRVAESPMPSSYSLKAERSERLIESFAPTELDIATEVTRVVQRGASDVEMGDLFVNKLKDFERAVEFYRSALDTMPAGPGADQVKIKLAVPLALEGIRTGDDGLRSEALDLVAAVADTDIVSAERLMDALKLSTDWLAVDRQRAFEVIQKISAREDLSSRDLHGLSRMLFDLFSDRDGNVYAQCIMVLRRLSREYPTSPEAPLAGVLRARMKFLAGDYVGALEGFQATAEVWRKPPVSELCEIGIGDCYLYSGGIGEAIGHYLRAGDHTPALLSLATCYELSGEGGSAADLYRRLLSRLLSGSLLKVVQVRLALLENAEPAESYAYSGRLDSMFPGVRDDLWSVVRIDRARNLAASGYAGLALMVLAHETRAGDPDLACDAMLFAGDLTEKVDAEGVLEVLEPGETHCADIYGAFRLLRARARSACDNGPASDCSGLAGRFTERFPLDEAGRRDLDALALKLMYREGLTDSAAAELDSMLVSGGGQTIPPAVIYRHGIQKLVDDEPDQAAAVFRMIEKKYPEAGTGAPGDYDDLYYDTCFKLGTTYFILKDYETSARYFDLASGSRKASLVENALFNRGLALEEDQRLDEAGQAFWTHAVTFPFSERFERSLMRSAYTLQTAGHPEDAIRIYRGLLQYAETVDAAAEAMYWTGECYAEMDQALRAACEFLRVAFIFPDGGAWTGTSAFRAGLECEKAGLKDHAATIYSENVRRFGTGSDWGKASEERLMEIEKEP